MPRIHANVFIADDTTLVANRLDTPAGPWTANVIIDDQSALMLTDRSAARLAAVLATLTPVADVDYTDPFGEIGDLSGGVR